MPRQPQRQRLVAPAFLVLDCLGDWIEAGANHSVGVVLYSEDQIGPRATQQTGRIRQGGDVLTQYARLVTIAFELKPFALMWLGPQAVEQGC